MVVVAAGPIYIYGKPVDMRKSFDGLYELVGRCLLEQPTSGDLFIFINRKKTYLKGLIWDRTGFVIIAKKLERGQFRLRNQAEKVVIDRSSLRMLLDGVSVGGTEISGSKQGCSGRLS